MTAEGERTRRSPGEGTKKEAAICKTSSERGRNIFRSETGLSEHLPGEGGLLAAGTESRRHKGQSVDKRGLRMSM